MIKSCKQGLPPPYPTGSHRLRIHVRPSGTRRAKRPVSISKKTAFPRRTVGRMPRLGGQSHESGNTRRLRTHQLGNVGTDARPIAGRRLAPLFTKKERTRAARIAHERIVTTSRGAHQRPNPRPLVHDLGHHGQRFVYVNARYVGRNGPELAAHLLRGVRLRVDQVLMRRRSRHVHHDDRLVRASHPCRLFGLQKLW